jgi:hypothetical protein
VITAIGSQQAQRLRGILSFGDVPKEQRRDALARVRSPGDACAERSSTARFRPPCAGRRAVSATNAHRTLGDVRCGTLVLAKEQGTHTTSACSEPASMARSGRFAGPRHISVSHSRK